MIAKRVLTYPVLPGVFFSYAGLVETKLKIKFPIFDIPSIN